MVAINTHKTDLEDQLEEGVKVDENDQKLQDRVAENLTKSLSTGYSLNEKGLILYKNRLYIPNVTKINLMI